MLSVASIAVRKRKYLVECLLHGLRRIAPRELFEDVYVAMGPAERSQCSLAARKLGQPNHHAQYSHTLPA